MVSDGKGGVGAASRWVVPIAAELWVSMERRGSRLATPKDVFLLLERNLTFPFWRTVNRKSFKAFSKALDINMYYKQVCLEILFFIVSSIHMLQYKREC